MSHGGHLTHGSPVNFSGLVYHALEYGVNAESIGFYLSLVCAEFGLERFVECHCFGCYHMLEGAAL